MYHIVLLFKNKHQNCILKKDRLSSIFNSPLNMFNSFLDKEDF